MNTRKTGRRQVGLLLLAELLQFLLCQTLVNLNLTFSFNFKIYRSCSCRRNYFCQGGHTCFRKVLRWLWSLCWRHCWQCTSLDIKRLCFQMRRSQNVLEHNIRDFEIGSSQLVDWSFRIVPTRQTDCCACRTPNSGCNFDCGPAGWPSNSYLSCGTQRRNWTDPVSRYCLFKWVISCCLVKQRSADGKLPAKLHLIIYFWNDPIWKLDGVKSVPNCHHQMRM